MDDRPVERTFRQLTRDTINKNFTVDAKDLQPWQQWYIDHLYCGGEFELVSLRRGPAIICSCTTMEGQ